jgi:AcrR family transcriptional regulator
MPHAKSDSGWPDTDNGHPAEVFATPAALMEAGLRCFARSGYARSRLTDIVAEAGVTTGALYGHFASKSDFFDALFTRYGDALQAALDECTSLEEQFNAWLLVSRQYSGVVRASSEVLLRRPEHAAVRRRLRESCAGLLSWHLREPLTQRDARFASRLLVDVLDQYALMEATSAIGGHQPQQVAHALHGMVVRGAYVK